MIMTVSKNMDGFFEQNFKIKFDYNDSEKHYHDFFELFYVTKGSITHYLNGNNGVTMYAGDYMFIDYGNYHCFDINDGEIINFAFTSQIIDSDSNAKNINQLLILNDFGLTDKINVAFPSQKVLRDNGNILKILKLIYTEAYAHTQFVGTITKSYTIALLLTILNPLYENNIFRPSPLLKQILKITEDHYNDKNPLSVAAQKMHFSVAKLSILFQNEYSMPFKQYLRQYRINQAKHLLKSTNMKIYEISMCIGYSDSKFFTKVFKQYTGSTPLEYRKTHALSEDIQIHALN